MILVRPMLRLLIMWHAQRPPVLRTWPTETPSCSETNTKTAREFTLVSSTGRIICVSSSLTLNVCSAFALEDGIAGGNAAAGSAHQLAESASPVLLTSEEASRVLTGPTATPTSEGPAPQMSNATSPGSITTPSTPVPNGQREVVAANRKRSAEAEETPEQRPKRINNEETPEQRRKRMNNEYSRRYHQRKKQELAEARQNIKRLEEANGALTHKNAALRELHQLAESVPTVLPTSEEGSRVLTAPTATPTSEGSAPQMSNATSPGSITTPSTPVPNGQREVVAANQKRSAEAEETPEQRRKRINNENFRDYYQRKKQELADARDNIKRLEEANGALTHKNAALREINDQLWKYMNKFPPLGRGKASSGDETPDASSEDVGIAPVAHPHDGHSGGEQGPHGGGAGSA
jgi:hypothetical protein